MEELTLSPRASARPSRLDFGETAAWALPPLNRFDGRPANDVASVAESAEPLPRWVVIVAGAVFAAALGALLGGALAV